MGRATARKDDDVVGTNCFCRLPVIVLRSMRQNTTAAGGDGEGPRRPIVTNCSLGAEETSQESARSGDIQVNAE